MAGATPGPESEISSCTRPRIPGFTVNPKTIKYYDVFHQYRSAVIVIASGYRPARNGKTHQDLLLTWIMGFGYLNLDNLRKMLEEVG